MLCARCHTHPLENWTQADYYGLASFFTQVERPARTPRLPQRAQRQGRAAEPRRRPGRPTRAPAGRSRRSSSAATSRSWPPAWTAARPTPTWLTVAEEPVLRPRPGEPRLELLLPPRHHRAGGRHPQHQPADQPGAARRPDEGLRRPQVRRPPPDAADRHVADVPAVERGQRRRTGTTSRTSRAPSRGASPAEALLDSLVQATGRAGELRRRAGRLPGRTAAGRATSRTTS